MDRVGGVFIACLVVAVLVTLLENAGDQEKAIDLSEIDTTTSAGYNWSTVAVCLILTGLYAAWW